MTGDVSKPMYEDVLKQLGQQYKPEAIKGMPNKLAPPTNMLQQHRWFIWSTHERSDRKWWACYNSTGLFSIHSTQRGILLWSFLLSWLPSSASQRVHPLMNLKQLLLEEHLSQPNHQVMELRNLKNLEVESLSWSHPRYSAVINYQNSFIYFHIGYTQQPTIFGFRLKITAGF